MKNETKKGFTLVELLVVITILAIISVVAYQNFGGAVDKAVSGRKISDVATIETSLQQYKVDKNFYPMVDEYNSSSNKWGYNSGEMATPSNTIKVSMNGAEIGELVSAAGGGKVKDNDGTNQIGAKGTISQSTLGKQYLTKDLYDPEVGDFKEKKNGKKLIEYGIGRYVYAVYRKPTGGEWTDNKTGTYYNIAFSIKKDESDTYITKIVGDYDNESCFENKDSCPLTLIGNGENVLVDGQEQGKDKDGKALSSFGSNQTNQGIPYATVDFE